MIPSEEVSPALDANDLRQITATTLQHYTASAEAFREGTRDHDVRQNIDALLRHIEGPSPFIILDFGCGPGRDLKAFRALGHQPIGLDGCPRFAEMARTDSGCEVWQQDFLRSICRLDVSTASSPTPRCSMSPPRNSPRC